MFRDVRKPNLVKALSIAVGVLRDVKVLGDRRRRAPEIVEKNPPLGLECVDASMQRMDLERDFLVGLATYQLLWHISYYNS